MNRRWISAASGALGCVLSAAVPAAAQAPARPARTAVKTAAAKAYTPPRTSWGDPDLQGMWPGNDGVPLQRPKTLGDETQLTDQQFEQKVAQSQKVAQADSEEFAKPDAKVTINPPSYWVEHGKPSRQTSLIIDPPDGRLPDFTPEGKARTASAAAEWRGVANSWEDLSLYYRCITRGVLGSIIPVIYNNGNQILQEPGYVIIRNEMIHETRVIPLDGRAHVSSSIRMYMGDSRGHWEGNTLVIDTTNFTDKTSIGSNGVAYNGAGGRNSEAMHLTERLTRTGPDTLEYRATIDDPKTWVRPWTMLIQLKRDDNYELLEYACHEGNYAMKDILSGARAQEQKKGEAGK